MLQQQRVQLLAQEARAVHRGHRGVEAPQEGVLVAPLLLHRLPRVDVALAAVDDADVAEAQRDELVGENRGGVGAGVHQIQLGDHADRAQPLRIHLARQLDGVAVRQVGVRCCHRHDDAVRLPDELQHHAPDDHLDVLRLVAHGDAAWKQDEAITE